MQIALNTSIEEGDMKGVRDCIILSQTFYLRDTNPKIFLHSVITNNPLLKTQRFWRDMIENALVSERNQLAPGTEEERKARLQAMVFGQLSSFSMIMQSFDCAGESIAQVISDFANRYELPLDNIVAMLSASDVQNIDSLLQHTSDSPNLKPRSSPEPIAEPIADPWGVSQNVQSLGSFLVRDASQP